VIIRVIAQGAGARPRAMTPGAEPLSIDRGVGYVGNGDVLYSLARTRRVTLTVDARRGAQENATWRGGNAEMPRGLRDGACTVRNRPTRCPECLRAARER
jgi:hypothetical protein